MRKIKAFLLSIILAVSFIQLSSCTFFYGESSDSSYESMFGTDIPILVDGNFDTTNGDVLAIVDSSTIEVRRLMPPTLITDLPVNKLAYKNVIAAFLTCQNIGEFHNALIKGIGEED